MQKRILPWLFALSWLPLTPAAPGSEKCCDEEVCARDSAAAARFATVKEVVDYVMAVAPPQHLRTLKKHSKSSFLRLSFKLDDNFDRRLALKDGNTALLTDAGTKSHRRAWRTIQIALWEEIQKLD